MKTIILAALTLISTSSFTAQAETYSLYVTHAEHINIAQSQLQTMVQKNILIDTTARSVRLSMSPVCNSGFCPEVLQTITFKLTALKTEASRVVGATADGTFIMNGKAFATRIEIRQNQNNATTIQIISRALPTTLVSTFSGSPAEQSTLLY